MTSVMDAYLHLPAMARNGLTVTPDHGERIGFVRQPDQRATGFHIVQDTPEGSTGLDLICLYQPDDSQELAIHISLYWTDHLGRLHGSLAWCQLNQQNLRLLAQEPKDPPSLALPTPAAIVAHTAAYARLAVVHHRYGIRQEQRYPLAGGVLEDAIRQDHAGHVRRAKLAHPRLLGLLSDGESVDPVSPTMLEDLKVYVDSVADTNTPATGEGHSGG